MNDDMRGVPSNVCKLTTNGCIMFWCPGCQMHHGPNSKQWQWNGSLDKPTLSPSILVRGTIPVTDEEVERILAGEKVEPVDFCCHSFVKDGYIEFLNDCTHKLAGQTVPIPPVV